MTISRRVIGPRWSWIIDLIDQVAVVYFWAFLLKFIKNSVCQRITVRVSSGAMWRSRSSGAILLLVQQPYAPRAVDVYCDLQFSQSFFIEFFHWVPSMAFFIGHFHCLLFNRQFFHWIPLHLRRLLLAHRDSGRNFPLSSGAHVNPVYQCSSPELDEPDRRS